MIETKKMVFIDESGDVEVPSTKNTNDFYVLCGVIIEETQLTRVNKSAKDAIRKFVGPGVLKSSKIGSDINRRRAILEEIFSIDIVCVGLVVIKDRIFYDSGLIYRKSFYKYCHKLFYQLIKASCIGFDVVLDNFGTSCFMNDFVKYINDQGYLFENTMFSESKSEPLIQFADCIAGSIRRYFKECEQNDVIEIGGTSLIIDHWPPSQIFVSVNLTNQNQISDYDSLIRDFSLRMSRSFIEANLYKNDYVTQLAVETLLFLLRKYYTTPFEYSFKRQIIEHLKDQGYHRIPERKLFTILRDEGIIISSTENGVKIPAGVEDISKWIERANSQIVPYLKRLNKARDRLLVLSQGKIDIVDKKHFSLLNECLSSLKQHLN